jgi:hypothetical protein
MSRVLAAIALAATACGACSDDAPSTDARPSDAPLADARTDAANPACTGLEEFTGELIDADSSPSSFLGVVDAVFTLRGEPGCTSTTAPNGRFIMTLPAADATVDVDAPAPYLDGQVVLPFATAMVTDDYSFRALSEDRAVELNLSLGQNYDIARGMLMVYQVLDHDSFTLTGAEQPIGTEDGADWVPGNDARYILFTNVDPGTQTLTPGAPGATIGGGDYEIVAGEITWVATEFHLE